MKKASTYLLCSISLSFLIFSANAQDTLKHSVVMQIHKTSEQADKLYGKKIQEQTLSAKSFEKMDTLKPRKSNKIKKKYCRRYRHH